MYPFTLSRPLILIVVSVFLSLIISCGTQQEELLLSLKEVEGVISSYTAGVVSSETDLRVRFTEPVPEAVRDRNELLFSLDPSVRGTQEWLNEHTVRFTPERLLQNDRKYKARLKLGPIFPEMEDALFSFELQVIPQDIEVTASAPEPYTDESGRLRYRINGRVMAADVASPENLSRVLSVRVNGQAVRPSWESEGRRSTSFQVNDIERREEPVRIELSWDGSPVGSSTRGRKQINLPSLGVFELIDLRILRSEGHTVELAFSDKIDDSANLSGLITIDGLPDPGIVVRNNRVLVYPRGAEPGERTLRISSGIRNAQGERLASDIERSVELADLLPEVRLLGSGVILPDSDELFLPFEAVNLGAVDVQVSRIFESNIPQFLQHNRLNEGYSIREVGRPVAQEVVPLNTIGDVKAGEWNSHALDLSTIIKPEPGALYRVTIGFRQHQSLYPCGDSAGLPESWEQVSHEEQAYWEGFDQFWVQGDYNWRDRDDPCTSSYYRSDRRVHRNALSSDIGLIAKRGETSGLIVYAAGLTSAEPLSGVQMKLLDYQQQTLVTGTTDREGAWRVSRSELPESPYLLVANRGDQRGFLRLDDSGSLSLSDFDVSGVSVDDGIKGFMYAERGVWRPGDSLFVNLMVEAGPEVLPDDHPVTFELIDPLGRVAERRVVRPVNRHYSFPTRTPSDARTGRWMAVARLGGNTFSYNLNIETIQPNRLRVDIRPDDELLTGEQAVISGEIFSEWLHGASAPGLRADLEMSMREGSLSFSEYGGFSFSDPSKSMETGETELFSGTLNNEGLARFEEQLRRPDDAPGMLLLNLTARVFEPSGNFSTGRTRIRYIPHSVLSGVRLPDLDDQRPVLDQQEAIRVEVVVLDPDGNTLPNTTVSAGIFELDWRWWWQRRNENLSQYFSRRNLRPIERLELTTDRNGRAEAEISAGKLDWGRYFVQVSASGSAHSAGQIFYTGWAGTRDEQPGSPVRLALETDHPTYAPGDDITLTFPGSLQGRALISIENGTEVLQTRWVETQPGMNEVRIPATAEMSPNAYVNVHIIQPHGQRDNDLPIRMYGITRIYIEDPDSRLHPVISLPGEIRPESEVQLEIREENGREMTYTIAMVDEGLLDLTNFITPDPHSRFYATEALGVRTFDVYDDVAGKFAGSLSRILAIGGDLELEQQPDDAEQTRFRPMVRFSGPHTLEKGQTRTHNIQIPNYAGSVRTMVVAGHERAFGRAEKQTPVRKPLMVLGTLPRVLGPGEDVVLPVSVFAMDESVRDVQVNVTVSEQFEVTDADARLQFERPGDMLSRFSLSVKEQTGWGSVRIDAVSGGESASEEIEIEIRNPNPPVVRVFDHTIDPGESAQFDFMPAGYAGSNTGVLELSSIPPLDLSRHLSFLNRYPYSSLEHRISSVFPLLFLDRLTGEGPDAQNQRRIHDTLSEMERYSLQSGGFVLWRGQSAANEWVSSYALHFMTEAERAGYAVPSSLKEATVRFQRRAAGNWRVDPEAPSHFDLIQAYRLYSLALSGNPENGAMNRLRERSGLSIQARWRLAAAYYSAGMPEAAERLIRGGEVSVSPYTEHYGTYGSELRDKAMILETLSLLGRREQAARVMRDISEGLTSEGWNPPQTIAFALIGAARFAEIAELSEEVDVRYSVSSLGEGRVSGVVPVTRIPYEIPGEERQFVEIENRGQGMVFARIVHEGRQLTDTHEAESSGLFMQLRYLWPNGEEVDPGEIRQGNDLIAEVTITNPGTFGDYRELALTQIFPSGWQIDNTRLDDLAFAEPGTTGKHQDVRDDRVLTYFDLRAGGSAVFRTRVTATWEGRFFLPPVQVRALYDSSIFARTSGRWVEVVRP